MVGLELGTLFRRPLPRYYLSHSSVSHSNHSFTPLMASHLDLPRPYPSSYPRRPHPSVPMSPSPLAHAHAFDQANLPQQPSTAYFDDNHRKQATMQETTWINLRASQTPRFPLSTLPSPSPPTSSSLTPLSAPARQWNDTKRRRVDHGSHQVYSSPHLSSDALTSSALSLASLSLSAYPNYTSTTTTSTSSSHHSTSSPISLSQSGTPLSSSSEQLMSTSPSSTPPSSPDVRKRTLERRHKGKQLKSRCTCCHVCRTSLKNYPRSHVDCTGCNAVVCQPCIEFRYPTQSFLSFLCFYFILL